MSLRIRLVLFVVLAAILTAVKSVFAPVSIIANNAAAVATVNGGDAAFIAQTAVHQAISFPWYLVSLVVLVFVFLVLPLFRNAPIK